MVEHSSQTLSSEEEATTCTAKNKLNCWNSLGRLTVHTLTTEGNTRQGVEVEAARAFVEVSLVTQWRARSVAAPQTSPRPEVVLAGARVRGERARGGDRREEEQDGAIMAACHVVLCICWMRKNLNLFWKFININSTTAQQRQRTRVFNFFNFFYVVRYVCSVQTDLTPCSQTGKVYNELSLQSHLTALWNTWNPATAVIKWTGMWV